MSKIRTLTARLFRRRSAPASGPTPSAVRRPLSARLAVRRPPFTRCASFVLCAASLMGAADSATPKPAPGSARRIVSLAPHLTELAFSAGAGDRIVGTVEYSDHPEAAREIPRIGDAFRVDLEQVLALRPDLVLAWESGTPMQAMERMKSLGLRVEPIATRRLKDVAAALRAIGEFAGTQAKAAQAASQFEEDVDALRAEYQGRAQVSVFVQVNDRPIYTVNGAQIMSEVVELCGGRNVFASLNELAPTVGIEAVIAANPQVILATDDTVPDAAAHWRRWRHIAAVQTNNVYTIASDDVARATTRLAIGAKQVCRTLDTARGRLTGGR